MDMIPQEQTKEVCACVLLRHACHCLLCWRANR